MYMRKAYGDEKLQTVWIMPSPPILWDTIRLNNINYDVIRRTWTSQDDLTLTLEESE